MLKIGTMLITERLLEIAALPINGKPFIFCTKDDINAESLKVVQNKLILLMDSMSTSKTAEKFPELYQ